MSVGIITGIRTGIRTGPRVGITSGIYAGFPNSATALKAVTLGYGTWTNIYTFDEVSGDLIDGTGAENLVPEITPVFRVAGPTPGKFAVRYDNVQDDNHYSGVGNHQLGTGEFTWLVVYKAESVGGTRFIASNAGTHLWQAYATPSSQLVMDIADGTTVGTATVGGVALGAWHVALFTVSRGAVQRLRIAVDAITPVESNISAVGAINPANRMRVGAGDFGSGRSGDMTIAYMAIGYTDAQNMRNNDSAIIANFKRNVGM